MTASPGSSSGESTRWDPRGRCDSSRSTPGTISSSSGSTARWWEAWPAVASMPCTSSFACCEQVPATSGRLVLAGYGYVGHDIFIHQRILLRLRGGTLGLLGRAVHAMGPATAGGPPRHGRRPAERVRALPT